MFKKQNLLAKRVSFFLLIVFTICFCACSGNIDRIDGKKQNNLQDIKNLESDITLLFDSESLPVVDVDDAISLKSLDLAKITILEENISRSTIKAPSLKTQIKMPNIVASSSSGNIPSSVGTSANASSNYYLGDYVSVKVTHYCSCGVCNGSTNANKSASGMVLQDGMSALNWLPLGSVVDVSGKLYVVEDRGVGKGRIDIFVSGGHSYALKRGTYKADIRIVRVGRNGEMLSGYSSSSLPSYDGTKIYR